MLDRQSVDDEDGSERDEEGRSGECVTTHDNDAPRDRDARAAEHQCSRDRHPGRIGHPSKRSISWGMRIEGPSQSA